MAARRRDVLRRAFFDRPAVEVAPDLLGCVIEHRTDEGTVGVRLAEVEAYHGQLDPGSHAFRGPTPRNAVMFGEPGFVYVYFTYGMHFCMNLVCEQAGIASAVLLRAGEVVEGRELASSRRGGAASRDLARGPARLTVALGVGRPHNGADACDPASELRVLPRVGNLDCPVTVGPRVGLAGGATVPWRFWLDGDPTVSVYRAHLPRRRGTNRSTRATGHAQGFGA